MNKLNESNIEEIIPVDKFNKNNNNESTKPTKKNRKVGEIIPVEEFTGESNLPKPVEWTWNNKTWNSYIENHTSPPDSLDLQEREFLRDVKVDKKPITKTVTKIVRLRARDYSSEKRQYSDFIFWFEQWDGINWLGEKLPPVTEHIEGMYYEQEMEPIVKKHEFDWLQEVGAACCVYGTVF